MRPSLQTPPAVASASPRQRRARLVRALGWALAALLLSVWLARLHDYRGWDQSYYLGQTSSLVEDGDVDLRNDLLHLQRDPGSLLRLLTALRPNGSLANTFAIGTSVLWLPVYAVTMPLRALGSDPGARWSSLQLVALQLASLAAMVWLLWALDRWLRRLGVGRRLAALTTLALVLGTPLVVYGLRGYTGSHLASAVAVLWLLLAAHRLGDRPSVTSALLCGAALGMVFLCRWQDLVKGLVLVVPLIELARRGLPRGGWLRLGAAGGAAALAVGGLQLHSWLLDRGELFGLPQGEGYLQLATPELGRFLLSGLGGLVPWSPLFVLAFVGLLLPWRLRLPPAWRWVALAILLFDVYLNATVYDWWGGAAYGPRRMSSDVPLAALGLANLAVRRRLGPPLAAALALVCLWGAVTVNLRLHGLRDLSILVRGRPSEAPGAEREDEAQPTRAEALEVATAWPFAAGRMSYFAGRLRWGRPLTLAIAALVCALVGWGLARPRAPDGLAPVLLAVLGLVLLAHLRLLGGGRADPDERRQWVELAAAAAGTLPAPPPAALERGDRHDDARRYLRASVLGRRGQREAARRLVGELDRPYPFTAAFLEQLALGEGERPLLARAGFFYAVREPRPARVLTVGRRVDLRCEAIRLSLEVEFRGELPGPPAHLVSLGRRGEPPLATVEVGERRVALVARTREEAAIDWRRRSPYRLELSWEPGAGELRLSVAGAGDGVDGLAAAASPAAGELGRLAVAFGAPPAGGPQAAPPWRSRYSELLLTASDRCHERRRGRRRGAT